MDIKWKPDTGSAVTPDPLSEGPRGRDSSSRGDEQPDTRRSDMLTGRGEPPMDRQTAEEILRAISSLSYGQVVLLVQDGKVVQIERTEKLRLR